MTCPTDTELRRLVGASTPSPHLATCLSCQERVLQLQAEPTLELRRRQPSRAESSLLVEGEKVGPYLVLSVLARGGMGVVYIAYHPELDRRVALKLIGAPEDSPEQQARLLREAQAMARLSHPNVVAVHDAGIWQGRVYIAMELVAGDTFDQWLARRERPWTEVVEVLVDAGQGLAAAHAAGLVHQDIKPENILVDLGGRARVTDFGIARTVRLDAAPPEDGEAHAGQAGEAADTTPGGTVLIRRRAAPEPAFEGAYSGGGRLLAPSRATTLGGTVAGTPAYMAPEQLYGEAADPRSDQFSFCVTAYEALCGTRPFHTTSEYLDQGAPPLTFPNAKVPRRISDALLRGLSVEANQRFPNLAALLAELSPIAERRYRWVAALVLAVAAVGAGLGVIEQRRANACTGFETALEAPWGPSAREDTRRAFLATGLAWAEATWTRTDAAMNEYADTWLTGRQRACEAARRSEQPKELLAARVACLERRLDELAVLSTVFQKANAEVVEHAVQAVGRLPPVSRCLDVTAEREPPAELRERVRQAEHSLAEARAQLAAGQYRNAREALSALEEKATQLGHKPLEAEVALALGEAEFYRFDAPPARAALERSTRAALLARDDATAVFALARLASLVGWVLHRPDEARSLARIGEALARRSGSAPQAEGLVAEALGDLEWEARNLQASAAHYRVALEQYERAWGAESLDAARAADSLAWVLADLGQHGESEALVRRALRIREQRLGERHPQLVQSWVTLSYLHLQQEQLGEAIEASQRGVRVAEGARGDGPILTPLANLGELQVAAGQLEDAAATHRRLAPLADASGGEISALADGIEAQLLYHRDRFAEAVEKGRQAVAKLETTVGKESYRLTSLLTHQGEAQLAAGDVRGAQATLERAVALATRDELNLVEALIVSSKPLRALGRRDEAVERLERALQRVKDRPRARLARLAKFELAQALWPEPSTRERALALANEALEATRQTSPKESSPREAAAIAAWLSDPARRTR